MNDKRYYWLKLKSDFFQQREIKKLRKIAGGDTYTIIYLKLQLLSLRNDCKLTFESIEDSFSEEMALEIDENVENVKMTLLFLEKHGLLEEVTPAEFILPKTLESIGTETQGAERMRKHRDAKKLLQGNAPVTDCDAVVRECNTAVITCNTEKEKELKLEQEQDLEQELELKNSALSVNAKFATDEEFVNNKVQSTVGQTGTVGKGEEYSADFLAFWQQYPRKKEKLKAWRAWKTRLKEKCSAGDMLVAAKNYVLECKGLDERYIKLGATFIGPDRPFEEYVGGGAVGEHQGQGRDFARKDYTEGGKYDNFFK